MRESVLEREGERKREFEIWGETMRERESVRKREREFEIWRERERKREREREPYGEIHMGRAKERKREREKERDEGGRKIVREKTEG